MPELEQLYEMIDEIEVAMLTTRRGDELLSSVTPGVETSRAGLP